MIRLNSDRLDIKAFLRDCLVSTHVYEPVREFYGERFLTVNRLKEASELLVDFEQQFGRKSSMNFIDSYHLSSKDNYKTSDCSSVTGEDDDGSSQRSSTGAIISSSDKAKIRAKFGLPYWTWGTILYSSAASIMCIYSLLKSVIIYELLPESWNLNHWHCYLIGRTHFGLYDFVMEVSHVFSVLLASTQVIYRSMLLILKREYELDALIFILQDESVINKEHERAATFGRKLDEKIQFGPDNEITVHQRIMHSIMYYPIWNGKVVDYKLRPNRTKRAHNRLMKFTIQSATFGLIWGFLTVFPLFVPIDLHDEQFYRNYPDCDLQLVEMYANFTSNYTVSRFTITWTKYRVVTIVADFLDTWFVTSHVGLAVIALVGLTIVLNYDLLNYWHAINNRLSRLLYKLKLTHNLEAIEDKMEEIAKINSESSSLIKCTYKRPFCRISTAASVASPFLGDFEAEEREDLGSSIGNTPIWQVIDEHQSTRVNQQLIEDEIRDIQAQCLDCFKQNRKVDLFVSDHVSLTVLGWLVSFVGVSYLGVKSNSITMRTRLYQVWGLSLLCSLSILLLSLHRAVMVTYKLICSVMAYDRSKFKKRFLYILYQYSNSKLPVYTLYGMTPIRPAIVLSLISWTLSSILITESLFKT